MSNPVMQALVLARIQDEPTVFGRWCITKNVRSLPAAPIHVAAFVRDSEPLASIETIWEAVQEVSQSHLSNGFADPTAGGVVAEAINSISQIVPPRSWPKELWPRFAALPYELQAYLVKRDQEHRREMGRAHNEAAKARQELAAIIKPAEATNGTTEQNATA